MRLTDLLQARIRTLDGEVLGRVHEVHCDGGKVTALMCGPGSWLERFTAKSDGRRIPWESVVRIAGEEVVVSLDSPRAARNRRGTRRPSAPRSKR